MGARPRCLLWHAFHSHFNPHAPHGGATRCSRTDSAVLDISIHTPRMGARHSRLTVPNAPLHFNPHAPHGGATEKCNSRGQNVMISIHTPRMGARREKYGSRVPMQPFQSTRPAWGRDVLHLPAAIRAEYFNPHAPRGARLHYYRTLCFFAHHFNPRARVGRDGTRHPVFLQYWIFQSTRPRGARPVSPSLPPSLPAFQSTRPRGARRKCLGVSPDVMEFQSTRPRGARLTLGGSRGLRQNFNPRARVGRDPPFLRFLHPIYHFNPRARVGRD